MAIDPNILNPMLDPFRKMAGDCADQGASGEAFDRMTTAMDRMEELGREMDDIGAYSAALVTEGLQMTFSTAYGEVLAEQAKAASGGGEDGAYDDEALLNQTLNAYRDAVKRIREGTEQAKQIASGDELVVNELATLSKDDLLIGPIEEAVKLGESGVNFPTFLRLMIEKGLDRAMEGAPALREGLEYDLGWAKASSESPHHIREKEEILAKFDELAGASKVGVPDSLHFELERKLIEHRHVPNIALWSAVRYRWEVMLDALTDWALAHTRFAPHIDPWKMAADPKRAVEMDKDCIPGDFEVRAAIFRENFNLDFKDIFSHDTFRNEVENFRLAYSQVWTEFLIEAIHPACKPMENLPGDIVKQVEEMFDGKLVYNPERHRALEKTRDYYDQVFGAGNFEKKAGAVEKNDSKAEPWNLASFKGA